MKYMILLDRLSLRLRWIVWVLRYTDVPDLLTSVPKNGVLRRKYLVSY